MTSWQGDKDLKATEVHNGDKARFVKLHTSNASADRYKGIGQMSTVKDVVQGLWYYNY